LVDIINDFGVGTYTSEPIKAIQVGGPLGAYLSEKQWQTPLDYEAFSAIGAVLGHGGIVIFDNSVSMTEQARFAMEFCAVESCGKCTPCRIGSTRGVEVIDKMVAAHEKNQTTEALNELLVDLCDTMIDGSLCAMGGMTPIPVKSIMTHFADDFITDIAVQHVEKILTKEQI
jgi:formate dehydrogenase iron-sulfur subunit